MSKSSIITISALWLLCTMYLTLATVYGLPYKGAAMAGSWIASALLLVCIIIFIRKNENNKNNKQK